MELNNSGSDSEWPESSYTMHERDISNRITQTSGELTKIRPFSQFDVEFTVSQGSAKWFVNDAMIQEIRDEWKRSSWFTACPPKELELLERQKAAKLIQLIGQQLSAPFDCIINSIVFMHRFYIFHPIQMFPCKVTALAALSLGTKSENQRISCQSIVKAMMRALKKEFPEKHLKSFLQEIIDTEKFMTLTLGCDLDVQHPFIYISDACKLFNCKDTSDNFINVIHSIAYNSLMLTTFCIRYPPKLVAAFCIHVSLKWAKYKIGESTEGKQWFSYIDSNITLGMLEDLKDEFIRIYSETPKSSAKDSNFKDFFKKAPENRAIPKQEFHSHKKEENVSESSNHEKFKSQKVLKVHNDFQNSSTQSSSTNLRNTKPSEKMQKLPKFQVSMSLPVTELVVRENKGIRSTVPSKIKPPKLADIFDNLKPELNQGRLDDMPEVYTTCKSTKHRVSHFNKQILSSQSEDQSSTQISLNLVELHHDEPEALKHANVKHDKRVIKKNKKSKRCKKLNKQKEKRILKLLQFVDKVDDKVETDLASMQMIPLRLTIKKTEVGGYMIKK